jgi:IS4 transposase
MAFFRFFCVLLKGLPKSVRCARPNELTFDIEKLFDQRIFFWEQQKWGLENDTKFLELFLKMNLFARLIEKIAINQTADAR